MIDTTQKLVAWAAAILRCDITDYEQQRLPWRVSRTPYRTFLAEFLLVRTRADAVAKQFEKIAEAYPNLTALAQADEQNLTESLAPLGLKKRVPFLIKAANFILENYDGVIPSTLTELIAVPGLGLYSATAIVAFGFGAKNEVPADVNVLRFLSRLTGLPMLHTTKGSKELKKLLPMLSEEKGGPNAENLLDFTRLICRPQKPFCHKCPLASNCVYFSNIISKN